MKIVIAGAGEVGTHLARLLSLENQDIILIDKDARRLAGIDATCNLLTVMGNPISPTTQRRAGVEDCDLFIAVTPFETENVVACELAKAFGAKKTVARIDNYEFMQPECRGLFAGMGINTTIYPEYLAALEIQTALRMNWIRNWFELHSGQLIVVGVKLRDNAECVNMQLKEFAMREHNFHVSAIRRRHDTIIPRGEDYLLSGDIVYFTTTGAHIDALRQMCGKKQLHIQNVMIIGGSRIAVRLVSLLKDSHYKFKIIEQDMARCAYLSERCPDADIICGDPRDIDMLRAEGIEETDCFIALNDSSEMNILACLTAKETGVLKTIAEVENIRLIAEAENLNIGTIINKKLLASSGIFQMMLDSDATTPRCLALADAEVAEIVAKPNSKITRKPVRSLSLPREITLAGLVRDGVGMLIDGNTRIEAGDSVVVFCLQGSLHQVEKLFY